MESVLTWKDIKLSREKMMFADRALLPRVNGDEAGFQRSNVFLCGLGDSGSFIHLMLENIDLRGIALQCMSNLFFEVVDNNEVGEERQDVLDLK